MKVTAPDPGFQARFLWHLFNLVYESFVAKSNGGTDRYGESWKPLKPSTIAYRPVSKDELSALGLHGTRYRGLLSPGQNQQWKAIFYHQMTRLIASGYPMMEAKGLAAKLAWAIMKSRGAQTKIGLLSQRKVPILDRTGRLKRSLSPGHVSGESYVPASEDQIASIEGHGLTLGTRVPYAKYVHRTRPIWPVGHMETLIVEAIRLAGGTIT
jgi:hypothetical protein